MLKTRKDKKESQDFNTKKNHIEQGTKITGTIETEGNLRLDGELDGDIYSQSKVVLGDSCKMTGNIKAVSAEISGEVNGKIEISELLALKSSAVINGEILVNKLDVEPGAEINGPVNMGAPVKNLNRQESEQQHKQKNKHNRDDQQQAERSA